MNIYVCITGEVKGPFDKKDVFAMLAEKQIALQDSALCEGDSEWATVDEVLKRSAGTLFSFEQIEEARREITPAAFLIPQSTGKAAEEDNLYNWVLKRRNGRKKGTLDLQRIQWLEAMGIDWRPLQSVVEIRMKELSAFRQKYGHCRVPSKWPQNPSLGAWVARQRGKYHRLPVEQQRRLKEFGFPPESRVGRSP